MHQAAKTDRMTGKMHAVIPEEQIQKRVREMARQISDDYQGKTIHVLAVLENGFMFVADLVRALEVPLICQFIKPRYQRLHDDGRGEFLEIFFSHEPNIEGQHVLLVEGLVHSGVTTDFLMSDLRGRLSEARNASGPAVGTSSPIAAGLFRLSRRRSILSRLWIGICRTDGTEPVIFSCGKLVLP